MKAKVNIAAVVHYCTNEYRFLKKLVEELSLFSNEVIIMVCDHFFNGTPERVDLLHQTYNDFPQCRFIEFAFYPDRLYNGLSSHSMTDPEWGSLWHATSRYLAALYMPKEIEYALFIDSDEIIEGAPFARWLETEELRECTAFRLACYFYIHRASLRAKKLSNAALFIQMDHLDPSLIINSEDRWGWFKALPGKKCALLNEEGNPFIHHYSWVRSKEECLIKANTWAHRWDKEWPSLIDAMFQDPNQPDLLNLGLELEESPVYFDPLAVPSPTITNKQHVFDHVLRIDASWARKREIERILN